MSARAKIKNFGRVCRLGQSSPTYTHRRILRMSLYKIDHSFPSHMVSLQKYALGHYKLTGWSGTCFTVGVDIKEIIKR
jgi:hypothetical protein